MRLTCRECKKSLPDHLPWCAVRLDKMRMKPTEQVAEDSRDDVMQALMERMDVLEKRLARVEKKAAE